MRNNKKDIAVRVLCILAGAVILSFGIHNIHERTNITEGGVLGLMLLINEWFGISPAYVTPVIDLICYGMAFKLLGASFIKWSVVSTASISMFYKVWESFPYMLPDLSGSPSGRKEWHGDKTAGASALIAESRKPRLYRGFSSYRTVVCYGFYF